MTITQVDKRLVDGEPVKPKPAGYYHIYRYDSLSGAFIRTGKKAETWSEAQDVAAEHTRTTGEQTGIEYKGLSGRRR